MCGWRRRSCSASNRLMRAKNNTDGGILMIETPDIQRPSKELIAGLARIGSATASGELSRLGIRDPHIRGLAPWTAGKSVVGPALTLQFMPKREDLYRVEEYADPEKQLHRH